MRPIYKALALTSLCVLSACGSKSDGVANASPTQETTKAADPAPTALSTATITEIATTTTTTTATATVTETATSVSTVTNTATISSIYTVTETQTVTATATVTETQTDTGTDTDPKRLIPVGAYSAQICFLNGLASEGMGQKIYTRSTIHFGQKGRGLNKFELFDDAECTKSLASGRLHIRYSVSQHFDRLLLIAIDQYNDPKDKKSLVRYWIPALREKDNLLFDIDASQGARGPYLSEPSEEELKSLLDGIEKRGVEFRKR